MRRAVSYLAKPLAHRPWRDAHGALDVLRPHLLVDSWPKRRGVTFSGLRGSRWSSPTVWERRSRAMEIQLWHRLQPVGQLRSHDRTQAKDGYKEKVAVLWSKEVVERRQLVCGRAEARVKAGELDRLR